MKHLKKFNEEILYFGDDDEPKKKPFDITEALDLEYIKSCFIGMIEEYDGDEDWEMEDNDGTGFNATEITYEIIFYVGGGSENTDNMIENLEESAEILKEIKSCIKKVQIEYPNVEPEIQVEHEGVNIMPGSFSALSSIKVYFGEESIKS